MFWRRKEIKEGEVKLPRPKDITELVGRYMVVEKKMDPALVQLLKAVVRKSATGETAFDIRVFDESDALANKVQVKDYTSLDGHPDLVIYEGCFNEALKQVELQERKKVSWDITIFIEAEIRQKIEGLSEPGRTVFFYMARGGNHGGPLGMGAAVIELNPSYPGKKQKKYNVYTSDVVNMQPVGTGDKLFDSDKPKDIARWIKEGHHKRMY